MRIVSSNLDNGKLQKKKTPKKTNNNQAGHNWRRWKSTAWKGDAFDSPKEVKEALKDLLL